MANRKREKDYFLRNFILAALGLGLGYYLFDVVSKWERMPFGQVFYIVGGGVLIAISALVMAMVLKQKFFPKKKRKKGEKPVFLKDMQHKKDNG